jgi:hypothetical protein
MHIGTDTDVKQLLDKSTSGIKVSEAGLYYESPETNCIEMKFPDWPGRAAYFSSKASTLGGGEGKFQGVALDHLF